MNQVLVAKDREQWAAPKPQPAEMLIHASRQSGRSPLKLIREYWKLRRLPGKISLPEYVQYGVYKQTPEAQSQFISNLLHWPITHKCCDMTWQATTEDKWLCSHILGRSDIAIPETLAVIDRSDRHYPATHKITNASELKDFALSSGPSSFFAKENRGICSFGAFLIKGADKDGLILSGTNHDGPISYQTVMDEMVQDTPYLLQNVMEGHSVFSAFTPNLATVRMCILVRNTGIEIPFAVLKLPSRDNVSDSFWRQGNLACGLDTRTGEILTARSKTPFSTEDHETHPETGNRLTGETLPHWDKLLDMVQNCAGIFAPVRYQSMDIAITESGPVLIEINTGGGFDLPQLATGQGFLTENVRAFFRECGYSQI